MLWIYLHSLLTPHFTNRTKMEGHAIHSKSCLHFQQDAEHVFANNRVWKTSGWLLGGMYQGQKHESGRLQDRERQVPSYRNVFQTAAVIHVWHADTHMYTQKTHTVFYNSPPSHHHTPNSCGPEKSCSASCFLNYPNSQPHSSRLCCISFSTVPFHSSHWSTLSCIPFLSDPFHHSPLLQDSLYPLTHSHTCDQSRSLQQNTSFATLTSTWIWFFQPWKWRMHECPKCQYQRKTLHGAKNQETATWII